ECQEESGGDRAGEFEGSVQGEINDLRNKEGGYREVFRTLVGSRVEAVLGRTRSPWFGGGVRARFRRIRAGERWLIAAPWTPLALLRVPLGELVREPGP